VKLIERSASAGRYFFKRPANKSQVEISDLGER